MSMFNSFETLLLALLFNASAIPDLAENDTTSPATNIDVALYTADPGEAGSMTTNEAAYTSYSREQVLRTSGGWTVSGNTATLTSTVSFTQASGGTETETHFCAGVGASGAGQGIVSGTVTPNISVTSGVTPQLTTATAITAD